MSAEPETGGGDVCLYHGTDMQSARDIMLHGLDQASAAKYNGSGEFWATTDPDEADLFAQVNPACGAPARFEFEIPAAILQNLLAVGALFIHSTTTHEFLPMGFAELNVHMSNRQVVPVP